MRKELKVLRTRVPYPISKGKNSDIKNRYMEDVKKKEE